MNGKILYHFRFSPMQLHAHHFMFIKCKERECEKEKKYEICVYNKRIIQKNALNILRFELVYMGYTT